MRRHILAALVALAAIAVAGAGAAPALAIDDHALLNASETRLSAAERHARTIAHWTPERMRAAIPREFARQPDGRFELVAKPGGSTGAGKGGGKPSNRVTNVTGASWTGGGPVVALTGRVYFTTDTGAWICSGAVVSDASATASLVLTAAHCAYDEATASFASNWMFIPAFDAAPSYSCGETAYGCWTADALVVHAGYASAGGFNATAAAHDYAIAVVGAGDRGAQLDAAVGGAYPLAIDGLARGERGQAFGYPAAGPYAGNDLTWCAGPVGEDFWTGNATWSLGCDMTGGSSGGPWLEGLNEGTGSGGALSSLNSYIYTGVRNMYGPKFSAGTDAVYQAALAGPTTDVIVGG